MSDPTPPLPEARPTGLDELLERCRALVATGERRILGIAGTPGAGKSTLCAALIAALDGDAVLVGQDGFHFANQELERLGRRDRKGAPDTFDVDGYVALLGRLARADAPVVHAPVFDRALEESIGSAVPVPAEVPLVITEGNYLLGDGHGWERVREHLHESWFLDVAPDVRHDRLVRRRVSYGHTPRDSADWVREVDEKNAQIVEGSRANADLLLHLTTVL
ncbi:nucleoside/nucleotide kinase family protein [Herbiconiux sp. CPCC 205716]|uniref:Nucleoside/nucleotide kinase family protein n=1 Tax=Herbiconiux gentiana TaxID=2970912 RepID=A0ABT2GBQ0_9MICO|nr:nucleoside/nucleotide kinase family protein [Herbiconiux gentiana]MCS5713634.1 nucleoside/nucleotide kinase family protein [Herbiconiux gentiana]